MSAPTHALRAPSSSDRVAALARAAATDAHATEALARLARLAADALRAPTAVLSVRDAEAPALLRVRAAHGLPTVDEPPRVMRRDEAPCHDVIATHAPVAVRDLQADPRYAAMPLMRRLGARTYLGVPLVARGGESMGALCVLDAAPRAWDEHEARLLAELAALAAGELERQDEQARRRRADEATRARERLFRAVFDRASQFMAVCSPDGVLLDVNQAALDLVGADPIDVVGHPFGGAPWWAWCSAQRAAVEAAIRRSAAGLGAHCSLAYLAPHGERRPLDFTATPVRDGDGAVTFVLVEGRELAAPRPSPVRCADPTCAYADALEGAPRQ